MSVIATRRAARRRPAAVVLREFPGGNGAFRQLLVRAPVGRDDVRCDRHARDGRADVPRFDFDPVSLAPRGLLIEGESTNYVPNNTGAGAVVGGALPTGWEDRYSAGITMSVAAIGTEDGHSIYRHKVHWYSGLHYLPTTHGTALSDG